MNDLPNSITEAAQLLRGEDLSCRELVEASLQAIAGADDDLGSMSAVFEAPAMATAEALDAELARGHDRGPLHGIPVTVKDIIATRDAPTHANSRATGAGWTIEPGDAPAIARLRRAGAVIIGKTTTAEFAAGMPDPDQPFPLPRNPWNLRCYTGGSSSGAAASVAAGIALGAVGTDTGGSVRIPAALCGVTGFKPTLGHLPAQGCLPLGYTLDQIGPVARTAADCAVLLAAMLPGDGAAVPVADRSLAGTRIGVPNNASISVATSSEVAARVEDSLRHLRDLGAELVDVRLPYYDEARAANRIILVAEAAAAHRTLLCDHWDLYHASTRALLSHASLISAAELVQAQRVRAAARAALGHLEDCDLVAMPTIGATAPRYDASGHLPAFDQIARSWFGSYWNAVGYPAVAIPIGLSDGLPTSLQLIARPGHDVELLDLAQHLQDATPWHLERPPLTGSGPPAPSDPPKAERQPLEIRDHIAELTRRRHEPADHATLTQLASNFAAFRAGIDALWAVEPSLDAELPLQLRFEGPPFDNRNYNFV